MDTNDNMVEEEIDKLTSEIEHIKTAIEELGKAKEQTENRLKDEIKKAKRQNKCKVLKKIDRQTAQTFELLNVQSALYDDMFCMHENCELHNKTQDVMECYRQEFNGLVNLYERLKVGFLKPTPRRFGCPCQLDPKEFEEYQINLMNNNVNECGDNMQVESFLLKKLPCDELDEEEDDELDESFGTVEG